jgi:hypothetical protein
VPEGATFYTGHLFITSCDPQGVGKLCQLRTPSRCK